MNTDCVGHILPLLCCSRSPVKPHDEGDQALSVDPFHHGCMGRLLHSNGLCEEFRRSACCTLRSWNCRRWTVPWCDLLVSACSSQFAFHTRCTTQSNKFPSITMWYRRHECGFRMAIFFSAATAAGAFGGLLARGIVGKFTHVSHICITLCLLCEQK